MNFDQKVVWITGASSGIGEHLAYAFSKAGARLILSSRKEKELERVKSNCTNPEMVRIIPLDVTNFDEVPSVAQQAISAFGQLDYLINNAGISQRASVKDTHLSVDQRIMDVNFIGTVAVTKAVLPHFLSRQTGHFVVISSVMGKLGTPMRSAYAASKHALHGFFDCLRAEVYDDNVKVTIICPGYVQTNVSINALTGDGSKNNSMNKTTAAGLTPEDFANKALTAIARQREEIYIGKKEILGIYIKRFFPKLINKIVRKRGVPK
jgi:dehydrogenase/reductase SDR family protein 7B